MPKRDWLDELEALAERLSAKREGEQPERPKLVLIQGGRDDGS